MTLENSICSIDIKVDETYTIDSTDNRYYDIIHNPCHYKHNDFAKTLSIHIDLFSAAYSIALIGPYHTYDSNCAILDGEILTVLQDDTITEINVIAGSIIKHIKFDCFGCSFGIYRVKTGYIIYGEIEIIMLDFDFVKKWSFPEKIFLYHLPIKTLSNYEKIQYAYMTLKTITTK